MSDNIQIYITQPPAEPVVIEYTYLQGPVGPVGPVGPFNEATFTNYLSTNAVTLCSIDVKNQILSAGIDLFNIFLTQETDSQTLTFNEANNDLTISNGNTVSLSSLTTNTDFDNYKTDVASATGTLVKTTDFNNYKTDVASATGTLVKTTDFNTYKTEVANLSGDWQTAYQQTSANDLVRSNASYESTIIGLSTINNVVSLSLQDYTNLAVKRPKTLYIIV